MQMVGPWGRYLPQWLRAPGNGSGPAICQHTHWTLPTTMSVLETPFDIHVSSVYQTHTCMQAPIPTLCISAKKTHNKGSRTRPIMSTLMPRSGIPVICSRATTSCDSSYLISVRTLNSIFPLMHQSFVAPAPSGPRNSGAFNFSIFKALLKAPHCRAKFVVKSPLKVPAPRGRQNYNKEYLNHLYKFSPLSRGGPT